MSTLTYYEKLKLSGFQTGCPVIIGLNNGTFREGVIEIGLINEDWEEDNEREALGLRGSGCIEGVYLDTIKFIANANEVFYAEEAASA